MKTQKINTVVHFAPLVFDEDIPQIHFKDYLVLLDWIYNEASYESVRLVCIDNNVFVSHDNEQIVTFIDSYKDYLKDGIDIFLQEYDSYESAYRVALSMQETSVFCYSNND